MIQRITLIMNPTFNITYDYGLSLESGGPTGKQPYGIALKEKGLAYAKQLRIYENSFVLIYRSEQNVIPAATESILEATSAIATAATGALLALRFIDT